MGSSASKTLTTSLFTSVLLGAPLEEIDAKIDAVKNEISDDDRKKFKLSSLRDEQESEVPVITAKKNLLMVSCIGSGDASTIANRLAFMKKYLSEFDINAVSDDDAKETCLSIACNCGIIDSDSNPRRSKIRPVPCQLDDLNADIIEFLLAEGADASMNQLVGTGDKWTPLHFASSYGYSAGVAELLARGADSALLTSATRQTILHLAAQSSSAKTVTSILAVFPKELRNAEDSEGNTAMSYACEFSTSDKLLASLIVNGCDFGTKYNEYVKAIASRKDGVRFNRIFPGQNDRFSTALFGRCYDTKFISDFRAAAGIADSNSKTTLNPALAAYPVVQACILGCLEILEMLLSQGYRLDQPCPVLPNSITPLHIIVGLEGSLNADSKKSVFSYVVGIAKKHGYDLASLNAAFDSNGNRPHTYNMSVEDLQYERFSSSDPLKTALGFQLITEQHNNAEIAAKDKLVLFSICINNFLAINPLLKTVEKLTGIQRKLFNDETLQHISSFTSLTTLNVGGTAVTDHGLQVVGENLSALTFLNVAGTNITDAGLQHVAKLTTLTSLKLGKSITDAGIKNICGLASLKTLNLSFCDSVTDVALQHISVKLTTLESLNLNYCDKITDVGAQHIGSLSALTDLNLNSCGKITDVGAQHISSLANLTSLGLGCKPITDVGLRRITEKLSALSVLGLGGTAITDAGLQLVAAKLPSITDLNIASCKSLSDAGIEHISNGLLSLKTLGLTGNEQLTDRTLQSVSSLTSLTDLNLWNLKKVTDVGVQYISKLSELQTLNLCYCVEVSDVGIQHLSRLTKLTSLNLYNLGKISDIGIQHLSVLTKLTTLDLSFLENLTDDGAKHLSSLKALTKLHLSHCRITNVGLQSIAANLTALTTLDLNSCREIGDAGLQHISTKLTALTTLDLSSCVNVSDLGLLTLSGTLRALEDMDIRECKKITADAKERFKDARPYCQLRCD